MIFGGRRPLESFGFSKGNNAFPIGGEGVLIELVQAPADVIAAETTQQSSEGLLA